MYLVPFGCPICGKEGIDHACSEADLRKIDKPARGKRMGVRCKRAKRLNRGLEILSAGGK